MSVEVGGWLSLVGFVGLVLSVGCWNNTERGSTFETLSAVGVLISALAAVVMIFKGLHLWHTGWDPGLTQMDPSDVARTAAKSRGRVGIILLVVQFFPQFLVFGYGAALWMARAVICQTAEDLGLLKTKSER